MLLLNCDTKACPEPRRHDKTYRRYAAGIERALASFEQTREWPDYISFLGRLLKVRMIWSSKSMWS